MSQFKLEIITPKGNFFSGNVDQLTLSTLEGQITVLAKHAPLVSPLGVCPVLIKHNGKEEHFALAGGLLYVDATQTRIITDSIVAAKDIDPKKVEREKEEAQKRIQSASNEIERDLAKIALAKAINKLRVRN